jgi:hypothetical protein
LGCIGAIDPSQVTLAADGPSAGRSTGLAREAPPPPWTLTRYDFALYLIVR